MKEAFSIRLAEENDIPNLEKLIPISARGLQAPFYTTAQIEAAIGPVFGVDRQLIRDRTYYVVEHGGQLVGCGGWSRRQAVFGGDRKRADNNALLDPVHDPARIRAFFVHPDWARRGIGKALLSACETALEAAGFHQAILAATLAGEPLYLSAGYTVKQRYQVPLPGDLQLEVVNMFKSFAKEPEVSTRR